MAEPATAQITSPGDRLAGEVLRVAPHTNPKETAAAIFRAVEGKQDIALRAIGASAVNQAVKALIIARSHVALLAHDLYVVPGFEPVVGKYGDDIEAVLLRIVVT